MCREAAFGDCGVCFRRSSRTLFDIFLGVLALRVKLRGFGFVDNGQAKGILGIWLTLISYGWCE